MSRAAAENEDLAPRTVSCHLCYISRLIPGSMKNLTVLGGGGGGGGGDRLYIARAQYCIWC